MSELRINNITDRAGSSGPIIAGVSTVTSTSHMVMPSGPTEMRGGRGRGVSNGSKPSTLTLQMIEIGTTGNAVDFGDSATPAYGLSTVNSTTRGIMAGGTNPGLVNAMSFITMSTTGDSVDFGATHRLQYYTH